MANWGHGAVTASGYAIAWQPEPTPSHIAMACAMAGIDWKPRPSMVVADLGCGRGYNASLLAAANPGWTVLGLDHDPSGIAEARQLAAQAGLSNTRFAEADLAGMSLAEIDSLPPLDIAIIHGVWSWVSDDVRAGIVRLLTRRLKPGGVAYLGYNSLPASAADMALQRLLRQLAGPFGTGAGEAAAAAARAMARLRGMAGALKLPRTPMLARLLADPPVLEPSFVAHEFLTAHWRPVFQADLCRDLSAARLDFVGSVNLFEALPGLFCNPEQMAVMRSLGDAPAQEFLKDLCLPRGFRADVFIRGARRVEAGTALHGLWVAAIRALPEESPEFHTGISRGAMQQPVWSQVATILRQGPARLGDIHTALGGAAPHLVEILAMLVGTGCVLPLFQGGGPQAAATRFNIAAAAAYAPHGEDLGETPGQYGLATPHGLGGLQASALDLAIVAALLKGAPAEPLGLARHLQPALEGERLVTAQRRIAARLEERLPVWQHFGVM
jgi:SAM-dependent methyltransferase